MHASNSVERIRTEKRTITSKYHLLQENPSDNFKLLNRDKLLFRFKYLFFVKGPNSKLSKSLNSFQFNLLYSLFSFQYFL